MPDRFNTAIHAAVLLVAIVALTVLAAFSKVNGDTVVPIIAAFGGVGGGAAAVTAGGKIVTNALAPAPPNAAPLSAANAADRPFVAES